MTGNQWLWAYSGGCLQQLLARTPDRVVSELCLCDWGYCTSFPEGTLAALDLGGPASPWRSQARERSPVGSLALRSGANSRLRGHLCAPAFRAPLLWFHHAGCHILCILFFSSTTFHCKQTKSFSNLPSWQAECRAFPAGVGRGEG